MRIKRKPTGTFGTIAPEPFHRRLLPFAAILILVILGAGIFIPGEYGSSNEERLAIGIFAIGVIFLELIERWIVAFALGLALWIGGMLAFIDFVLVVQGGDPTLSKRWFQSELSPLAAVVTASLGLGLAVLSRRFRRRFQTVLGVTLGFLAIAISGVALWGYLNGITSAYQWSRYPALAAPSAVGFMVCGLLVVGVGYGSLQENQRPSTRSTAIALGFSTAIGVLLMIAALFNEDVPVHRPLGREARQVRVALENAMADLIEGATAIEGAVSRNSGGSLEDNVRALITRHPALVGVGFSSKEGTLRVIPSEIAVNQDAWGELLRDVDTQKQTVFSRVVKQGNDWAIYFTVRSGEKGGGIVGGIVNLGKLLTDATDDLPPEVGIRIRYAGNDLLDRNLPAAADNGGAQYELSFPLAGRPGWQLALSESETHVARSSTAALFKFPVTIFLAGAAIWWGLISRRRLARAELLVRDIEQSLAEEGPLQERAVIAMEGARDIIVMTDPEERLTYINQSGRMLLRSEAIQGLFLGDLLTVGTLAEIRRIGFVTARQSGSWSNVGVIKTPEFGELPVAVRILPHVHPDGRAEGYSLILTYIHHLRGTSTTKVFSSTPVWLLADRLPVPLWAASPDGAVEYANQALLSLLATDLETFRANWPAGYLVVEDEEQENTEGSIQISKEGKHRLLLRTGDGRPTWVDEEVLSLKRPDATEKSCILGIITEANREQRAIQQAGLLSALEELLSIEGTAAYWVHNITKDAIIYAASATSTVLGINNDELKLRPEAWRGLIPGDVEIPTEPKETFKATYSLHRDDGDDLPVEHCVVPFTGSAGGDEFRYALHLVSPVNEGSALIADGDEIGALRAFRIENEHLYRFLTRYVHDGARQVGTLGRFIAEAVKGSVPADVQADLIKLGKETERLVGCLQEFSEIARVQRVVTKSEHSTLGEAIGRLQAMRYGLPAGITFSGDLTFEVRCPPELLDHTVRSIAVFAIERSIGGAAREIVFGVHAVPGGTLIRCSLGDMPLSRDELARAFLPGAEITKSGQILPSLAAVSAVARRLDGRAWLSRSTDAGIVLQITMRS